MPIWTNAIPDQPRGHALPIRRTPAARPIQAIVTSHDLIGCYTHYYHGSTCPCEGPACPHCLANFDTILNAEGRPTHLVEGKILPCEGPACKPCEDGLPFRWHAYFSALDCYINLHFIMEVTAIAAKHFTDYRDQHGTLRGCHFQAKRWNNRPNGRILISTKPADLTERKIPEPVDLQKCMAIIWSLPSGAVSANTRNPETETPAVTIHRPPEEFKS